MPFDPPAELSDRIDAAIAKYAISKRSAVLPVLHLIQEHERHIPDEAIPWVAAKLDLPPVQVLEVVTFYPGFRQTRPGKCHIRVCRTLSCAMAGSYELMEKFCEAAGIDRSGVDHHHPIAISEDGRFSVEFAECLASCGTAPVCLVEDDLHENVAPGRAGEVLAKYGGK